MITPSFNQGNFIERTIQSVLNQDVDVEYVVFDAASADLTVGVLRKYSKQLKWVSEPDQGQADAVNKGVQATNGEIIAWINLDDIYLDGTLKTVEHFFDQNAEVDVLYGDAWYIDVNDRKMAAYQTEPWNLQRLSDVCYICQPAAFFRRRIIDRFGFLDVSLHYCMDYEFWLRIGQGGARFAYQPTYLAGSRMYPENKTLGQKMAVHLEINDMLKNRLGRVPDSWLYSYAHYLTATNGLSRSVNEK